MDRLGRVDMHLIMTIALVCILGFALFTIFSMLLESARRIDRIVSRDETVREYRVTFRSASRAVVPKIELRLVDKDDVVVAKLKLEDPVFDDWRIAA